MAYDEPADFEPLVEATRLLIDAGLTLSSHTIRAYVLCGYPQDTIANADLRMRQVSDLGVMPMAMLYERRPDRDWRRFQRSWTRPQLIDSQEQKRPASVTAPTGQEQETHGGM